MDTKEIVPNTKFVPIWTIAAERKVISRTGTSAYACDVRSSTETTTTATRTEIVFISCAISSDCVSPRLVVR